VWHIATQMQATFSRDRASSNKIVCSTVIISGLAGCLLLPARDFILSRFCLEWCATASRGVPRPITNWQIASFQTGGIVSLGAAAKLVRLSVPLIFNRIEQDLVSLVLP
jgi:hypothetical protein